MNAREVFPDPYTVCPKDAKGQSVCLRVGQNSPAKRWKCGSQKILLRTGTVDEADTFTLSRTFKPASSEPKSAGKLTALCASHA